jgi:voltage-gated potassium channel Kch
MLPELTLGSLMILATTVIHGTFTAVGIAYLTRKFDEWGRISSDWRASVVLSFFVLWLFLATVLEVWAWALLYVVVGALEDFQTALYFSTVTFTTLGYGDVILDKEWRLLASFEAANGLFLFGWSTALVFAVVQWVFELRNRDGPTLNPDGQ